MKRDDIMETIRELKEMFLAGAISQEEFEKLKMEFLQEQNLVPASEANAAEGAASAPPTPSASSIPSMRANSDPFIPKSKVSQSQDVLSGVPIATTKSGSQSDLPAADEAVSEPGFFSEHTPPFQQGGGPSHTPSQGIPASTGVEDRTQQFMNLYTQATQQAGTDPNGALRKLEEARLLAPELCDDVFRQWVNFAKYTLQEMRAADPSVRNSGILTPHPTDSVLSGSLSNASLEQQPSSSASSNPFEPMSASNPGLDASTPAKQPLFEPEPESSPFEPISGSSNPFEAKPSNGGGPNPFVPQNDIFESKPAASDSFDATSDTPDGLDAFVPQEADLLFEDDPPGTTVPSESTNPGFEMPKSLAPEATDSSEMDDPTAILLEGVNDLLGEEDFQGAFDLLEHLKPQHPDSKKIETLYKLCRQQIEVVYKQDYQESETMFPVLTCPPEELFALQNQFDHRAGFLFSQMNGATSIEDLISISGMEDFDVFRTIEKLKDRGMLRIETQ